MRNPKILIIGKTVASSITLKYTLQNQDFIINTTDTSAEGLLTMLASPPDIIIIDAEESTCKVLRKIESAMINSAIILITHKRITIEAQIIKRLGIETLIEKPYHFCDILSSVHTTIYSCLNQNKAEV